MKKRILTLFMVFLIVFSNIRVCTVKASTLDDITDSTRSRLVATALLTMGVTATSYSNLKGIADNVITNCPLLHAEADGIISSGNGVVNLTKSALDSIRNYVAQLKSNPTVVVSNGSDYVSNIENSSSSRMSVTYRGTVWSSDLPTGSKIHVVLTNGTDVDTATKMGNIHLFIYHVVNGYTLRTVEIKYSYTATSTSFTGDFTTDTPIYSGDSVGLDLDYGYYVAPYTTCNITYTPTLTKNITDNLKGVDEGVNSKTSSVTFNDDIAYDTNNPYANSDQAIDDALTGKTGTIPDVVGSMEDIPNTITTVPDTAKPTDTTPETPWWSAIWDLLKGLWSGLFDILNKILTALLSIPKLLLDLLNTIKNFIANIFAPPTVALDFSSLQNISIKTKFPFCLPFDLINSILALNVTAVAPTWTIPLSAFVGGTSLIIDFSQFSVFASIVRWAISILFTIALILLTHRFIKSN